MSQEQLYPDEYQQYLERYEIFGEGRPSLSAEEFDLLDDEILELLALEAETGELSSEQEERLRALEYLMILY